MIEKIFFWNIKSINTQKTFERLLERNRRYHYSIIALMEQFQEPSQMEEYNRKLGFNNAAVNCSRKIWYFWKEEWEALVMLDTIQQVPVKFCHNSKSFIISVVYARCNVVERLELW